MTSERELSRLVRLFERADKEVNRQLLEAVDENDMRTVAQRRAKQAEIRATLAGLRELAISGNREDDSGPAWKLVRDSYREGSAAAIWDMNGKGVPVVARSFSQLHMDAAEQLYASMAGRLDDAIQYIGRRADGVFRRAALRATLDQAVQGGSRVQTSEALRRMLEERGVRAFRDAAGREWTLENYARMAARTTRSEAVNLGTLNRLAENGIELVQISEHGTDCPICAPYEGMVFSIRGGHPTYPDLDDIPPYHPQCKHVSHAYIEELRVA